MNAQVTPILPMAKTNGQAFEVQKARIARQQEEFRLKRKEAAGSGDGQLKHLHDVRASWAEWVERMGPVMMTSQGSPPGLETVTSQEADEALRRIKAVTRIEGTGEIQADAGEAGEEKGEKKK